MKIKYKILIKSMIMCKPSYVNVKFQVYARYKSRIFPFVCFHLNFLVYRKGTKQNYKRQHHDVVRN